MARRPETVGKPLTHTMKVGMNSDMLAYVDRRRGGRSRARYLRELVRKDAEGKVSW